MTHPRRLIISLTTLSVKLNTTLATYRCLAVVSVIHTEKQPQRKISTILPKEIIMPSTAKQAKATAWESVCANPFTRVHGRPTCHNYENLKEEIATLASEVADITYTWSRNATDNYGLLANILGTDEYDKLTNINSYAIPLEPASYNPTITNATLTHERIYKEEEWELMRTAWFI
jgi:hypothetical protein